jgi:hypothetical protein
MAVTAFSARHTLRNDSLSLPFQWRRRMRGNEWSVQNQIRKVSSVIIFLPQEIHDSYGAQLRMKQP